MAPQSDLVVRGGTVVDGAGADLQRRILTAAGRCLTGRCAVPGR